MTSCEFLTDRMPAVAHGRSTWTSTEAAHLAGCADCRHEWQLVQGAVVLGDEVAGRFDAEAVARRVLLRMHNTVAATVARPRPRTVRWATGLAAAAALAMVVGLGRVAPPVTPPELPAPALLAELEGLSAPELEEVLDDLPATPTLSIPTGTGLGDLTEDELERILRSMEG